MKLKGKIINFLGDSITQGVGTSDTEKRFSDIIARDTGAICNNYGISGTRIARQKVPSADINEDKDFCSRIAEMDCNADIIIVFGGTNDFGHGDAQIGKMSDRTPYTFYGALHTLYTELAEKYPGKQIVIITPLHRWNEDNVRGDGYKTSDAGVLKEYVDTIREVAEYYAFPVLDLYARSGFQPKVQTVRELYMPDGLHPNDMGHENLAQKIIAFLGTL